MLEVGRITKVHGLRGEVVVVLTSDRIERLDPGSMLDAEGRTLVVASSRPHADRWLVHFEGVQRREDAEPLRGLVLSGEPLDDPEVLWVHELIGCEVRTVDGTPRGRIESVQDNPASDLLVLDTGALVPVVFVSDGPTDGVVLVDVPDGLFELTDGEAVDEADGADGPDRGGDT